MAKITYTNKVQLNTNPSVADINKGRALDWNEVKEVVNTNDDNVGDLTQLDTTDKTSIVNAINEVNKKNDNHFSSSSSTTIPLNTNWTATADGIVQYGGYGTAQITLEVNGVGFGRVCSNSTLFSLYNTAIVNKGDVIKISTTGTASETNTHVFRPRI